MMVGNLPTDPRHSYVNQVRTGIKLGLNSVLTVGRRISPALLAAATCAAARRSSTAASAGRLVAVEGRTVIEEPPVSEIRPSHTWRARLCVSCGDGAEELPGLERRVVDLREQ